MAKPLLILATDFSDEAARSYPETLSLARELEATVQLVHVVPTLAWIPYGPLLDSRQVEPDLEARVKAANEKVASLASELGSEGVEVHGEVLTGELPEKTLADAAEERGARFLIMSSHGRSGLRRIVLGSFAETVLRQAVTPVIIIPRSQ